MKSADRNTTFFTSNSSSLEYHEDYAPIAQMYSDQSYQLSIQNIEDTKYRDQMFDYVTSLSVIEHGVNIEKYFREISRIIKSNGYLLTSTDYWPHKLVNNKNVISKSIPDNIFSRDEIENLVEIAEKSGLKLIEPIDFEYKEKVVRWDSIGRFYLHLPCYERRIKLFLKQKFYLFRSCNWKQSIKKYNIFFMYSLSI